MTAQTGEFNNRTKRQWEPMRLTYVAHVSEIVLGGGGKVSIPPGDPGEVTRCPPGHFFDPGTALCTPNVPPNKKT